ncbi:MAG TPA: DUF3619 family protein [Burkholderiales bacterium]|nr:DUF3619 family protein [Burkholderiales bacterium]
MNEPEFGNKIRHLLNQGAQLDPRVAERLRAARGLALARGATERASALAWAGGVFGRLGGLGGLSLRLLLPVALLGIALTTIYGWQQNQKMAEFADIDSQLLADDLPIDAYLDKGFDAWLQKHAAR